MSNRICKVLKIEKPVICGPMAWTSTASLVAAVSNAGGLGVLGVGFATPDYVREQVEETKKLTDKPFAINTILEPHMLERTEPIIEELIPPVVYADSLADFELELCKKYFKIWHELGAKVVVKIADVKDAVTAEIAGADVIVAKGWEGGGHVTLEATSVLVPAVVDAVKAPVVAAGGIADGRGFAAAISLGAEGIEMGTTFLAAEEVNIHPNVKQCVVETGDMKTVITGTSTGEPCRQIANSLSRKLQAIEAENIAIEAGKKLATVAESSLKKAMLEGDMDNGAVMAGQVVNLVHEIKPVAQIINDIIEDGLRVVKSIQDFSF